MRGLLERHRPQLAVLTELGAPAWTLGLACALMVLVLVLVLGLVAGLLGVRLGMLGGEALARASPVLLNLGLARATLPWREVG